MTMPNAITKRELERAKDLHLELSNILEHIRDASRVAQFWGWSQQVDTSEAAEDAIEKWIDDLDWVIGELEDGK